jgi:uroporphyrin-III C-methyltransferase
VTVYLVGAGPGSADLLTLKAARLLAEAQVVVIDRLIDESVRACINADAEVIDVGKRPGTSGTQALINDLLVTLGARGGTVVRLKGGDPFVFGRGYEEVLALEAAGIPVEVVPGVSSALAAPTAAGIPVTHRDLSRGVVIVTGTGSGGSDVDLTALAQAGLTIVLLMGVERRAALSQQLLDGGLDDQMPVAAIEWAWTDRQRVVSTTLAELATAEITNPAVLVIGAVAGYSAAEVAAFAHSLR